MNANQIFLFSDHALARIRGRQYSFGCHLHLFQVFSSCRLIVLQVRDAIAALCFWFVRLIRVDVVLDSIADEVTLDFVVTVLIVGQVVLYLGLCVGQAFR